MSRSAPDRWPISSERAVKSGICWRDLDAAPHPLGRFGELAHRLGDGVGERQRQHQHHRRQHQEDAQQRPALRRDDGIDVAALGREQQRAANRRRALDRHADRDDRLARGVDPNRRFRPALQRGGDFGQRLAVGHPIVGDARFLGRREGTGALRPTACATTASLRPGSRPARREASAPRADKGLRIEQQQAVAIVNARARARRRRPGDEGPGRRVPG